MSDQGETALRPDPAAFGRSIPPGLGINLLVADVARSARFQAEVFGARIEHLEAQVAIAGLALA